MVSLARVDPHLRGEVLSTGNKPIRPYDQLVSNAAIDVEG
jgi:hypothetical protein